MTDDATTDVADDDYGFKYGWFYSPDDELVYNPQSRGTGPIIITRDGDVEGRFIDRARRKVAEGKAMLWGRLGPVEIDGVEIRQNTEIWHDDWEMWLRATEIELIEEPEPEPRILFEKKGTWPQQYVKYPASRILEMREEGIIESKKEVNDRLEEVMEEIREEQ